MTLWPSQELSVSEETSVYQTDPPKAPAGIDASQLRDMADLLRRRADRKMIGRGSLETLEETLRGAALQIDNLVLLVSTLSYDLRKTRPELAKRAVDFLSRNGLAPSLLRKAGGADTPEPVARDVASRSALMDVLRAEAKASDAPASSDAHMSRAIVTLWKMAGGPEVGDPDLRARLDDAIAYMDHFPWEQRDVDA